MEKEKDRFAEARARQSEMADRIAAGLIKLLDAALWFPLATSGESDLDTDAVRLLVTKELEAQVRRAIDGYTDWAVVGVIRSKRYGKRLFPFPVGGDVENITRKYGVKAPILEYVAERLAGQEDSIPFLGLVRDGLLVPDEEALKAWSKFCDLSMPTSRGGF